MTGARPGAIRDLGLDLQWQFAFIGMGERATTRPHALFLDVGGACGAGVIDQHQGEADGASTAALVLRHPENVYEHLMAEWLAPFHRVEDLRNRPWRPLVVTHFDPDFDALVASWLARRLIEDGAFPDGSAGLVQYVDEVDQGAYRIVPERPETWRGAVHLAWLSLQADKSLTDADRLVLGHAVLDRLLARVVQRSGKVARTLGRDDFHPEAPGANAREDAALAPAIARLEEDRERFEEVDRRRATVLRSVRLPAADGGAAIDVEAFVLAEQRTAVLDKYWVRALGTPLYVARVGPRRVIVSVDPTWRSPDGRAVCLRGLGRALELREQATRGDADVRAGLPRFAERWCRNSDPWYDGRGHAFTIVDSPRAGTELDVASIVEVLQTAFWSVEVMKGSRIVASGPAPLASRPSGWSDPTEPSAGDCLPQPLREVVAAGAGTVEIGRTRVGQSYRLELENLSAASLDDLVSWAERLPPGTRVAGSLHIDGDSGSPASRDGLVLRLLGGTGAAVGDAHEGLQVGPKGALRIGFAGQKDASGAGDIVRALTCAVTWLDIAAKGLDELTEDASRRRTAGRLQRALVVLERKRLVPIQTLPHPWRSVATAVLDSAAVLERFRLLRSEVDRLVETEETDVERQVQNLLGLFTVVGVASATTDLLNSTVSVSTIALGVSLAAGWAIWLRQSSRAS